MKTTFIGVGSNLGRRDVLIGQAREWTGHELGKLTKSSGLYETSPWGNPDQPNYLNQVWELQTGLNPFQLLEQLLNLEKRAQRERREKWGARTLDLDLLFYEDYQIRTEELTLPHPFIQERNFVLIPMAEIAPDWVHPVLGKTISALASACQDQEPVWKWSS